MRSRRPEDIETLIFRWRRRFWLATAVVVFLAGDVALWTLGPSALSIPHTAVYGFYTMLSERATKGLISGGTSTIATAASFSVSAGSFSTQQRAAAFAAGLDASGLPILVRARPEDGRFQVLVGPYVSTDEAETAQRQLATWGLGEARLVVDDTMRGRPQRASMFGGGDPGSDGVLIVAAPGMSSIVFEMQVAPRQVELRRTSATTLDIDIGTAAAGGRTNVLRMPEGMLLARELVVETAGRHDARHARLVLPEDVRSRLRLEGRRVYVDLAWPKPAWEVGATESPATQIAQAAARPGAVQSEAVKPPSEDTKQSSEDQQQGAYREQLRKAEARFDELRPFLLSAIESPDTQVLAVLSRTLEGVGASLTVASPPSDLAATHQLLLTSIADASRAMAPSFAGDRRAAVTEAIATFEGSRK